LRYAMRMTSSRFSPITGILEKPQYRASESASAGSCRSRRRSCPFSAPLLVTCDRC
jgi:hypothetical protein